MSAATPPTPSPTPDLPTLVLVHGAGLTARVWHEVQAHLRAPSLAVDLPGRGPRPADLTTATLEGSAAVLAADVEQEVDGPVVLVGHSAGGLILPQATRRIGARVRHLVFVAGLIAAHGRTVSETVAADRAAWERMQRNRAPMLDGYRGSTFVRTPEERAAAVAAGLQPVDDGALVQGIESMNLMFQPVSWEGVPDGLPRTFVRCLRDPIQSRPMQAGLVANCAAGHVVDIDTGHTPAREAPAVLAAILDTIAASAAVPAGEHAG